MADMSTTRHCSNCLVERPLDLFKADGGQRIFKTCKLCRDRNTAGRKRTSDQAGLTSPTPAPVPLLAPAPARQHTSYHYRGLRSSDDQEQAAARKHIRAIQRENRVKRRAGEDPDPTPSLSALIQRQTPGQSDFS